jgi:hypothetical protein
MQPANDAPRLLGPPRIQGSTSVRRCCRMGMPVPPHGQMERMRGPASSPGLNALSVQGGGKISIGEDTRQTEFVQQEANVRRSGTMMGSHGFFGSFVCTEIW